MDKQMKLLTLFGAEPSPYVRKVRLALEYKKLAYQGVPVFPFSPDVPAEFTNNSPTGKIPLLKADDEYITDSDVIIAYLERQYPEPALMPKDNILFAKAHWFSVYASTTMVSCLGGHLFAEQVLAKTFFNREPNQADIDLALNEELPAIFDYLESQIHDEYLVGMNFTLADLCVGAMFVLMRHCKIGCDANKWPLTAAYIDRVHGLELFKNLITHEQQLLASYGITL